MALKHQDLLAWQTKKRGGEASHGTDFENPGFPAEPGQDCGCLGNQAARS